MTPDRPATRLAAFARLPRAHRELHLLHSTVDSFGRAHWLLTERPPEPRRRKPYDAVVVTVEGGRPYETHLSALQARFPRFDALPDGGFVVAGLTDRFSMRRPGGGGRQGCRPVPAGPMDYRVIHEDG